MEKAVTKELPFNQFEKIGLNKEAVLNLPKEDLKNLMSGHKTGVVPLKIDKDGIEINIEAKLSLIRNSDDTISLNVHPYRKEIDNKFNLDANQLAQLKKGEIVEVAMLAKNGEQRQHLVQLDKSINELVSVVKDKIKIPDSISDIKISNEQKEQIASGKSVSIKGEKGELKVQLDLNDAKGIRIDSPLGYERNGKLDVATKNDLKY